MEGYVSEIYEPGSKPWHQLKFLRAVRNGNLTEVEYYMETDLDINEKYEGTSALHVAIQSRYIGREKMVALLLENGANPNTPNNQGKTSANILTKHEENNVIMGFLGGARTAVKEANKEIADLLIKHGAETDSGFKSSFPDKKEK